MATPARRINVTLDEEHARKLAIPARITEILDAIPGAWERTQEGIAQADRSEGTPLSDLI